MRDVKIVEQQALGRDFEKLCFHACGSAGASPSRPRFVRMHEDRGNEVQNGAMAGQLAFQPDRGFADLWPAAAALLAGMGVRRAIVFVTGDTRA